MAKNPDWSQTLSRCKHVSAVIKQWKDLKYQDSTGLVLAQHGSILQSMLIPALKDIEPIQAASLDPGRRSEYALIDRILVMILSRSNWNDPFSPSGAIYNAAPFDPHLEDPS
jgi:hypothetical protein